MQCLLKSVSHRVSTTVFISVVCLGSTLHSQTDVNDVHIVPRAPIAVPNLGHEHSPNGTLIKKSVDLVLVAVTITDDQERVVTGLDKNNFKLFEGKQQQEIKHFSSEDTPASIGIIFDTSKSMDTKWDRAREAVTKFCASANPQDEFFMITFADTPHLIVDFTSNTEQIQNALVYTQPQGRTALFDAVYLGVQKMRQARYERRALLVISDGGDNHSRYTQSETNSLVKEADVMIYGIGVFDLSFRTPEEADGPLFLSDLSEKTGGRTFIIDTPNSLPVVAEKIGAELRTQYVLGYRPEPVQRDGKWHKIRVKLMLPKNIPYLQVHNKTGYYAPKD